MTLVPLHQFVYNSCMGIDKATMKNHKVLDHTIAIALIMD